MIEKIIYDYLSSSNLGAPVYTEIPKNPPSAFFVIEKTGGAITNHIESSTVAIQSYAASLYEASVANELVKDAMLYGLIDEPEVASVELNSDYNFTDVETRRYRYQSVFSIVHY